MSTWLAAGGSAAGIVASGVIEAGSLGAMTPIALATLAGSVLFLLSSLAANIAASIALADCYEANGKHEAAEKVRQRVTALQAEYERLTKFAERIKAVAA